MRAADLVVSVFLFSLAFLAALRNKALIWSCVENRAEYVRLLLACPQVRNSGAAPELLLRDGRTYPMCHKRARALGFIF